MKLVYAAAAAIAFLAPGAAFAQTAPAPAPTPAPAAKFNLDTPIETIAADPAGRSVLEAVLPELLPHPAYEQFKGFSLRQLQPMSQGQITDETLTAVEAELAKIK